MTDLIRMTATEVVDGLRRGTITPLDCLDALERRIGEVDGLVNALPTRCFDRARRAARASMARPAAERRLLCGLPCPSRISPMWRACARRKALPSSRTGSPKPPTFSCPTSK